MGTKKLIAIGIIFLFIGVAVAPSINSTVVKASNDNNLIEVTSQACGIQGFGNTTVKLTKQQFQDLQQYLVDFRARLNQTTTREEAVPIFKDAVVELNKYGLLPKGMSVEKAQKLILKKYPLASVIGSRFRGFIDNLGCLVAGAVSPVQMYGPLDLLLIRMATGSSFFIPLFSLLLYFFNQLNPISIGSTLTIGSHLIGDHINDDAPSEGWVKCIGLLGYQQCNGSLYGQMGSVTRPWSDPQIWEYQDYIGVYGFCGIKVGYSFLGSALVASIDSAAPHILPKSIK